MSYLTPKKFENYLRSKNLKYMDLFNQFVKITLTDSYHYWRMGHLLKKIKKSAGLLFKIMHFLGLHPFLVYFLDHQLPTDQQKSKFDKLF